MSAASKRNWASSSSSSSSSLPKRRKNANDEEEYDSSRSKMKKFAKPHSKPYMAAIYIDDKFVCGGSLISPKTVLTAAHCVVDKHGSLKSPESITVVLGAHDISNKKEATRKTVKCSKIIKHFEYKYMKNDIAILHLTQTVEFKENVIDAIKLPSHENKNYDGDLATASGWGWANDSKQLLSNELREVTLRIIDNSTCNLSFDINDNQLCTSGHGGKGTCNGDSGGPLVASTCELIGVTSFGAKKCENGAPSVFTRVTKYLVWIKENIAE